jgi:hypothetical protein|tara:strand:+ start:5316 stop:6206 length:891 start_codon:yes stop_codon:yes gene_type:complete
VANKRNYIIYTFPWDENIGGVIFMHNLVHELNRMGERAFLWKGAPIYKQGRRHRLRNWLRSKPMLTNPLLDTPVAHRRDLSADSIVIYPELVRGNPLKARHVVRWLLYKPGLLHPFSFGPDEMFFRAGGMSDVLDITGGAPDLYLWKINPVYRNENRPNRRGVCYMVRKGKDKPHIPETEAPDAIRIDGLSHAETNEIFNRCDTFYSYDEATMYSQFAAICGCTSVVVRGMFSSREEWAGKHPKGRLGIAYGTHPTELEHARTTRHLLLKDLQRKEEESLETVRNFVNLTRQRFWA